MEEVYSSIIISINWFSQNINGGSSIVAYTALRDVFGNVLVTDIKDNEKLKVLINQQRKKSTVINPCFHLVELNDPKTLNDIKKLLDEYFYGRNKPPKSEVFIFNDKTFKIIGDSYYNSKPSTYTEG